MRGFVRGAIRFEDDSELYVREFLDMGVDSVRLAYAYHYQNPNGTLIFRYDNAAHRPPLSQAEHKHTAAGTTSEGAPTLRHVVDEIVGMIHPCT